MTSVRYNPPAAVASRGASLDLGPCLVCVMMAKGAQLDYHASTVAELAADAYPGKVQWLEFPALPGFPIYDALVVAPTDAFPNWAAVPLCWQHLAVLRDQPESVPQERSALERGRVVPVSGSLPKEPRR